MSFTLLVAHSTWLVRKGLRAALAALPDLELLDGVDTLEALTRTVAQRPPDAILLGLPLLGTDWHKPLQNLLAGLPQTSVMVVAETAATGDVADALELGCVGCLGLACTETDLSSAITALRRGETYLDADISRLIVQREHCRSARVSRPSLEGLTERELEVFRLVGAGYTSRAAAARLTVSAKTVDKHRAAVMGKLGLSSAMEMRLLAQQLELG